MAPPVPLPAARLAGGDFFASLRPQDLAYFCVNVGDGDAQLVLLPAEPGAGRHRAVIVDAGRVDKLTDLVRALVARGLLVPDTAPPDERAGSIALVVSSHPHLDHIAGMAQLLRAFPDRIAELWDPGYFHTLPAYHEMMAEIERMPRLLYAQPTSGFRRWIGNVAVTVLSPSIQLRNRFDTYGTEINDASISVRLEFPAARVIQRTETRELVERPRTASVILGADAQTLSWSYVLTDFPYRAGSDSAAARAIAAATPGDFLRSQLLKVSHHASKHGVNLELVERIDPALTLVSSVGGGGRFRFPHTVAQELIRKAVDPSTSSERPHPPDWQLGVLYTSDTDDAGAALGTIGVVMSPTRRAVWRFGDGPADPVDLGAARRWS